MSLNETLIFQYEAKAATDIFHGEYDFVLNSDDTCDHELPFMKNKSNGGTMILWRKSLCKFITILPSPSVSFSALLFHPPGYSASLQVALYLPTSGKEDEFVDELTNLRIFIEDQVNKHPDILVFIRGDSNVNEKHVARSKIFENFKTNLNLTSLPTGHKTYHHFLGNGLFDSAIDVILCTKSKPINEQIEQILCKNDHLWIKSHHDAIISTFTLPLKHVAQNPSIPQAPEIPNL